MESLPLTPAGKIDLDAPPAPGVSDGAPGIGAVAPRDLMETKMAAIRAEAPDALREALQAGVLIKQS